MPNARTSLIEGTKVLTTQGIALIGQIAAAGVTLHYSYGDTSTKGWAELDVIRALEDGEVCALSESLRPLWDALADDVREAALFKLEIVQEILTGYRDGHHALARPGEPRPPYGPSGASESKRCTAMAKELNAGAQFDRRVQGRLQDGETRPAQFSSVTIRYWVRGFKERGLLALIDERSTRQSKSWELIDERYRQVATQIVDTLDGDRSTISNQEIDRRTRIRLKENGIDDFEAPQRITSQFLATLKRERGATTRAQKSRKSRKVSGAKHYPAIRPGQVVAIDVTRADNLVYDPLTGQACSVEIITAIDVATRVVLAIRVVPRSADGIEAGLLLYDICRAFSLMVEGTSIGDWRWVGLPEQLDLTGVSVQVGKRVLVPEFSTLQGEHGIPSVLPDAVRCDHGAIFVSKHFRALLQMLGIDLMLNRGGKPKPNTPHGSTTHSETRCGTPGDAPAGIWTPGAATRSCGPRSPSDSAPAPRPSTCTTTAPAQHGKPQRDTGTPRRGKGIPVTTLDGTHRSPVLRALRSETGSDHSRIFRSETGATHVVARHGCVCTFDRAPRRVRCPARVDHSDGQLRHRHM